MADIGADGEPVSDRIDGLAFQIIAGAAAQAELGRNRIDRVQ